MMNIEVEYRDRQGNITKHYHNISMIAFIKHMAWVGQKYMPRSQKIMRAIGMLFRYSYFLRKDDFNANKFSLPPDSLYDPTEKSQFSNLVGKAIADFLAKKIDKAICTLTYEAAMKMKGLNINGSRPDLLAFSQNTVFAVEAKARSEETISDNKMKKYKQQAGSGPILVNFSVVSVAFNIYRKIKCKYYDPDSSNSSFDNDLFQSLTKQYYGGLLEFLKYTEYSTKKYQNEYFYKVELSDLFFKQEKLFKYCYKKFFYIYRPMLILPIDIKKYAKEGLSSDIKPFLFKISQDNDSNIYIDNDRVGLSVRRKQ